MENKNSDSICDFTSFLAAIISAEEEGGHMWVLFTDAYLASVPVLPLSTAFFTLTTFHWAEVMFAQCSCKGANRSTAPMSGFVRLSREKVHIRQDELNSTQLTSFLFSKIAD